jgi:hypothetical protein
VETEAVKTKEAKTAPVGFGEEFWFWVKLGFINFGGPAGQIAIMHRELVGILDEMMGGTAGPARKSGRQRAGCGTPRGRTRPAPDRGTRSVEVMSELYPAARGTQDVVARLIPPFVSDAPTKRRW